MSGVAKDETTPVPPSEGTPDATAQVSPPSREHTEEPASAEGDGRGARRGAPFLRVVTDNEDADGGGPQRRIGAIIRSAREDQGLTLEAVARDTRIHLSHLRAIEDMTPGMLGAPVYAKGYIRNYARHLKLDPDEILSRYLSECAILSDPEKQEIAPPVVARKLPVALPVMGLLVVALAVTAIGVFVFNSGDSGSQTESTASQGATDASGAVVPAGPALRLVAVKRARIEVRGADGTKFLARFLSPGESYTPRVGAGWTVTTEDGSAFEWRLGEDSLGLLAAEGGHVYAQSVDTAALRPPIPKPVAEPEPTPVVQPSDGEANALNPAAAAPRPAAATPSPAPRPRAQDPAPAPAPAAPVAEAPVIAPPPAPADPAVLAYPEN
jgi:cytoskeleton protein RodZ